MAFAQHAWTAKKWQWEPEMAFTAMRLSCSSWHQYTVSGNQTFQGARGSAYMEAYNGSKQVEAHKWEHGSFP